MFFDLFNIVAYLENYHNMILASKTNIFIIIYKIII